MAQKTQLLGHLEEYSRQLQRHLDALQETHSNLQAVWMRLRDIYEGEGAEMFSQAYDAASDRTREYTREGLEISRMLQVKIDELRVFNSTNPGL